MSSMSAEWASITAAARDEIHDLRMTPWEIMEKNAEDARREEIAKARDRRIAEAREQQAREDAREQREQHEFDLRLGSSEASHNAAPKAVTREPAWLDC